MSNLAEVFNFKSSCFQVGELCYNVSMAKLMTRVIVLASTIISGYGFYQHSISKIGRKEKAQIEDDNRS